MDSLISLGQVSEETMGNFVSLNPNPPVSKRDGVGVKASSGQPAVCIFVFQPDEVESDDVCIAE